ncbi:MAG: YihY/virulence factor BrkB family protein [Deltaproteobacteria bacterium]|nr:YihY/virulence factor BrkB family protein [Deltaproteobacteria bacterium]
MMRRLREQGRFLFELFERTGDRFSEVEGFRLGAAFSYYATFSIFPLLLLTVTVFGFVLGDGAPARERMLSAIAAPDSPMLSAIDGTLAAMQASRGMRGLSAVVAVATLLFGASGAFVELDTALNKIWLIPPRKEKGILGTIRVFLKERLSGFAIVGGIGLTLLASLVASAVLGGVAKHADTRFTPALIQTAELAISIVLLSAVFTMAFHLVPRSRPPIRDVVGGAVLTTVMLTILKETFASYLQHLTSYSAYGVVGGVLALATWIYLSSQIIFLGATVTRVHCEMVGCPAAAQRVPMQECT